MYCLDTTTVVGEGLDLTRIRQSQEVLPIVLDMSSVVGEVLDLTRIRQSVTGGPPYGALYDHCGWQGVRLN